MKKIKGLSTLLALGIVFSLTPGEARADSIMVDYNKTYGVNVRSSKSLDNENVLGGLEKLDDIYEIKDEDKNRYEISFEDRDAYVAKDQFVKLTEARSLENTHLKEKPNKESVTLANVKKGDSLVILGFAENNSYLKVKHKEKIGYIRLKSTSFNSLEKEYLDIFVKKYEKIEKGLKKQEDYLKSLEQTVEEIVDYQIVDYQSEDGMTLGQEAYTYACNFLGNPYVFGGTDLINGIDCSGFTQAVFGNYGIYLPHFAQSQASYGRTVKLGEEEAGDLVFYGTGLDNITHVAIADGMGGIVHAANPKAGIISSYIGNPLIIKRLVEN